MEEIFIGDIRIVYAWKVRDCGLTEVVMSAVSVQFVITISNTAVEFSGPGVGPAVPSVPVH